jgi:hypothetical protein
MTWGIRIATSESQNPGANQSTVAATLYLTWNNRDSYAGFNFNCSINIGGNVRQIPMPTSFFASTQTGEVAVNSHTVTFNHNPNGERGAVGTSGNIAGPGGPAPGNLTATGPTYPAINYDRKPAAPTTVTATLNVGKSITVESNEVSSPAGTPTYHVAWSSSSDGGATWGDWSAYTAISGNARSFTFTFGTLPPGVTYRFRMFASNSDGNSAATVSGNTVFLPAGGKRWDGSAWQVTTTAKRWTGSTWTDIQTAKRWSGSAWVDLS